VIESKVSHEIGCWFASVGKIVLGREIVLQFLRASRLHSCLFELDVLLVTVMVVNYKLYTLATGT